jgi:hypothetical protein
MATRTLRTVALLSAFLTSCAPLAANGKRAVVAAQSLAFWSSRYRADEVMRIPVREYGHAEYAEDPANRSLQHGQYQGRRLVLTLRGGTRFDFVFESDHPDVSTIAVRDIDVALITPNLPQWTKGDPALERIALTDRQWNRQQVSFERSSPHVEVSGGDGFERERLSHVDLAKNCLNAGLWEIQLFVQEGGQKALYYQGWFTFPLGHYRALFETNTGLPYAEHAHYLEHWFDPTGTVMPLAKLRRVLEEREVATRWDPSEPIIAAGEQVRKQRTTLATNVRKWGDLFDGREVRFATFVPPGLYRVDHPRSSDYPSLAGLEKVIHRKIASPATERPLDELEIVFRGNGAGRRRFLVSGFEIAAQPQLAITNYPQGMYMPMGIGIPPFSQAYAALEKAPPDKSAFMSLLLDDQDRWIDHHSVGVDGAVVHRDEANPNRLHLYLLSYERHCLIAHFTLELSA